LNRDTLPGEAMRRPSFFLSSTIYDFKDLRSALKYMLEEQGCSVLASEYNDFPKPLDENSYDACIKTLQSADYYVLLIGARVGGWYDKETKISITQQEYREAYNLHLQGKLKLLCFVRADIWRLREDRKELSSFLETLDIDPGIKLEIRNHPSKSASDAEFISSFISEVCRNKENKAAQDAKTSLPTGNWVHIFETFKDVAELIQTQAFSGIPVDYVTLRRLLLREMLEILRLSLAKYKDGHVYSPTSSVFLFHHEHTLTLDSRNQTHINVNAKRWDIISALSIQILAIKYNTLILQRALESAAFLSYDIKTGTYKEEPIYDALYQLHEEIRRFKLANTNETMRVVFENTPRVRQPGIQSIPIEPMKLFSFLHLMDRWVNIIELSSAIIRYLRGKPFSMPNLRPRSPIPDMNKQLEVEDVSIVDVDKFLEEDV